MESDFLEVIDNCLRGKMNDPLKIYDAFKADYPDLFFSYDEKDERSNVLTNVDDNPLSFYTREKLGTLMTKTTNAAVITFYSHYKNYNSNIFYTIYTPHTAPPPTTPTLSGADAGGLKALYFKEFQEIEEKKRKEQERDLKIKALEEKFQSRRTTLNPRRRGVVIQALIQNNAAPIARRLSGITGDALKPEFFHPFLNPNADIPEDFHDLSQRFLLLPTEQQLQFKKIMIQQLELFENDPENI